MNILFTCYYMDGWHGSVRHILEYGEYLSKFGHNIHIAAIQISDEFTKYTSELGIKLYKVDQLPLDDITYDIVFAYHLIIFPYLLNRGLQYKRSIYGCLSSFLLIERLPIFYESFDILTSVSDEVVQMFNKTYNLDKSKFKVIPNHIPESYYIATKKLSPQIRNICIVSNHPPQILKDLINHKGMSVSYFGMDGPGKSVNITPNILIDFDVIITIGKTVQYGLGMGIPVYEYDHFGGCGYITPENMLEEEKTNFSGRGTNRIFSTSQELIDDMIENYASAVSQAQLVREMAWERYRIDKLVNSQLHELINAPSRSIYQDTKNRLFNNACHAVMDYILSANYNINEHKACIDILNERISTCENIINENNDRLLLQEKQINESNEQISDYVCRIDGYLNEIKGMNDILKKYEEAIIDNENRIKGYEIQSQTLSGSINEYINEIQILNNQKQSYNKIINELNDKIDMSNKQMEMLSDQVRRYNSELASMYNSRSWRITRPLRAVRAALSKAYHKIIK